MALRVSDQEFDAVRRLPAPRRLEYLVKRVADQAEIWSLRNDDGWVLAADDRGRELFPVWPHARYAEASAVGHWAGAVPGRIEVHDWLGPWTTGLAADERLVAVFPTDRGDEAAITPAEFAAAIQAELDRIE